MQSILLHSGSNLQEYLQFLLLLPFIQLCLLSFWRNVLAINMSFQTTQKVPKYHQPERVHLHLATEQKSQNQIGKCPWEVVSSDYLFQI
jgi:hypothetical protein